MRALTFVVSWTIFAVLCVLTLVVGVVAQVVALPLDPDRKVSLAISRWLWCVAHFRIQPFWTVQIEGVEHTANGPFVIVANHQSMLDIPACQQLPLPSRTLSKASNFRVPLLGQYMRLSKQIEVDTSRPETLQQTFERCRHDLSRGISIVVFPEGHRSPDGRLQPFKKGAFRLAKDAGAPLLPVVIDGTRAMMPKGGILPLQAWHTFRIRALEPVNPDDFLTARSLQRHVRKVMLAALPAHKLPRPSDAGASASGVGS